MLVKQVCQKNAIFLAIGILKILVLSMNHTSLVTSALDTYLCNGCHDLMQKAMSFNDVAIMLKEVHTEFALGIWAKMMQLA